MEIEALFVAAGDNVILPLPVALVEGRRRARWYPPGTPDSLAARKAKVLHQVNSVIAQSKIRRRPVDRFYARHFDLRQGPCRRFGRPHRRRLLRMCCKRPCRRAYASEQADELAPLHSITSSTTAFVRAQPSGGRTTQNKTPLFGPTCLGAQTCAPPSGATKLLILSLGTGVHSPSTLTSKWSPTMRLCVGRQYTRLQQVPL